MSDSDTIYSDDSERSEDSDSGESLADFVVDDDEEKGSPISTSKREGKRYLITTVNYSSNDTSTESLSFPATPSKQLRPYDYNVKKTVSLPSVITRDIASTQLCTEVVRTITGKPSLLDDENTV